MIRSLEKDRKKLKAIEQEIQNLNIMQMDLVDELMKGKDIEKIERKIKRVENEIKFLENQQDIIIKRVIDKRSKLLAS